MEEMEEMFNVSFRGGEESSTSRGSLYSSMRSERTYSSISKNKELVSLSVRDVEEKSSTRDNQYYMSSERSYSSSSRTLGDLEDKLKLSVKDIEERSTSREEVEVYRTPPPDIAEWSEEDIKVEGRIQDTEDLAAAENAEEGSVRDTGEAKKKQISSRNDEVDEDWLADEIEADAAVGEAEPLAAEDQDMEEALEYSAKDDRSTHAEVETTPFSESGGWLAEEIEEDEPGGTTEPIVVEEEQMEETLAESVKGVEERVVVAEVDTTPPSETAGWPDEDIKDDEDSTEVVGQRSSGGISEADKTESVKDRKISRETSELEGTESVHERKISREASEVEKTGSVKERKISREISEIEKTENVKDRKISREASDEETTGSFESQKIYRETSEVEKTDGVKERKISRETSEVEKTDGVKDRKISHEASEPEKTETFADRKISRETSETESIKSREISRETSEAESIKSRKISRETSETEKIESVKGRKISREAPQAASRTSLHSSPSSSSTTFPLAKSESKSLIVQDISEGEPTFTKTIRGVHINPGDKAVFTCTLEDRGHNSVTWLRNNQPFSDKLADRVVIKEDRNTFSLIIKNCNEHDNGLIAAKATNASGLSTITSAQLIVDDHEMTPTETKEEAESAPRFIVCLKDTQLLEKTHARFMIKVAGNPRPKLTFRKNGSLLSEDERIHVVKEGESTYDLEIVEVQKGDNGSYECTAENSLGTAKTSCEISLTAEKDLWKSVAQEKLLPQGEEPEFEWFKDGERFDPEERFKVLLKNDEDTLALVFQHVRPEDAGLYTCVASTSCGKMSCSAELTVQGAVHHLLREPKRPEIEAALSDTEVSVGGSAMLELKVSGFPKPECVWSKNGEPIHAGGRYRFLYEDDNSIALIIKNVDKNDAGCYKVIARNDIGEAETQGNLIVRAPPKFKNKTSDVACMTDTPIKCNVEVEGSPCPDVKWYKDGQLLMESERIKLVKESEGSYSLLIERVILEDSGSYSIVASNECGQMSEFFHLTANSPPKFLRRMEKLVEAHESDNVALEVDVCGHPTPNVHWYFKEERLEESSKISFVKKGETIYGLKFTGVTRKQTGKVTCKVSNDFGHEEDAAELKVFCKPEIQSPLQDVTVTEGEQLNLECAMQAYPKPEIHWYHEGTEITEISEKLEQYAKITEELICKLVMKEAEERMAGSYSLSAVNEIGKAECSANVNVKFRPKVIKDLVNLCETDEGNEAVLNARIKGNPRPATEWFGPDGKKLSPSDHYKIEEDGDSYTLTIPNTRGADTGEYTLMSINEVDVLQLSAKILVNTTPRIAKDCTISCDAIETDDYVLEFKATAEPKPEVIWTKNGEKVVEDDRVKAVQEADSFKLILSNIQMEDAGEYECLLENRLGKDSIKGNVTVSKIDEVLHPKIKPWPVDTVVIEDENVTLSCKVYGTPVPEITWYKDAKEIENSDHIRAYVEHTDPREKRLRINVAKEEDLGEYTIFAKNEHGECESQAHLEVKWKPKLKGLRHLKKVVVEYGDEITIQAVVNANPKEEVTWLYNGQPMERGTGEKGYQEDGATYTLHIKNADYRRDDGKYRFIAKNEVGEAEEEFELEVHTIKPYFKLALENSSAPLNAPLTLLARIDGLPKPTIATWYKNDEPVSELTPGILLNFEEGFHELKIERMGPDFLGKYSITGESEIGECKSSCQVTCETHPPYIDESLPKMNRLKEGEKLTLAGTAKGSPLPVVTWYKDGVEVVPDGERIRITADDDGNHVLVIEDCVPDDSGEYRMAARNKFGEVSSPASVEVKGTPEKPHFVKPLENTIARLGEPADIVAQVKGCPKPKIKWCKDGKPIHHGVHSDPDGTTTYHIACSKAEDCGIYSITATNESGEETCTGTVKVEGALAPPKLISPMKNVRAVEGFPVKLEAAVSGNPVPEIIWMKGDDVLIPDGERVKVVQDDKGTVALIIEEAHLKDTGEYTLIAKSSEGEDKRRAKIVVMDKFIDGEPESEPFFKSHIRDMALDEGAELRLKAEVQGNPRPDVEWRHNNVPIEKGGNAKSAYDGARVGLVVPNVRMDDAGDYLCVLKNIHGEAKSACHVTVKKAFSAPEWTQKFTDQEEMPSYDAKIVGKVTGIPCPTISWFKDGAPLRDGGSIQLKRDGDLAVLFIQDCKESDTGLYTAEATNCEGTAECSAQLNVVPKKRYGPKGEPPSFLKRIGDCEVYEGMSARFTACIAGYPDPEYAWYKDNLKLQPSNRVFADKEGAGLLRLTISGARIEDAGRYKLEIWNEHGKDHCESNLTFDGLQTTPSKPRDEAYQHMLDGLKDAPIISRMTDRQLKLSWKPSIPHGPRDPVTYKVEIKDEPNGSWKPLQRGLLTCALEVRNLRPGDDYSFRVIVESKYGESEPSPVATTNRGLLAHRPPERFTLEPGDEFNPETSSYFPADFDLEREPYDKYTAAPRFLRQPADKQYGVKDQPTNIRWFVYGYPKPNVQWFFNGDLVKIGGRFGSSYTRNGCATLFINGMLERDEGTYECVATNEIGEARQRVPVELAVHPKFITRFEETHALAQDSFRLECRLTGVPYPDVKWYKDWQPIAASNRIKILWLEPDRCILVVNDCIPKDSGLYSCSGTNICGTASTSSDVHVEDDIRNYDWKTFKKPYPSALYKRPLKDMYDIGQELGRGTQGVTSHAVQRGTGENYAAKSMVGFDHWHDMENEAKIMEGLSHPRLTRLYEVFDEGDCMTLITDLGGGGELLDTLANEPSVNEFEIAQYIRQVLEGLQHLHEREIAHLGLTPGDIILTRPGGDEIKICDFGLAKALHGGRLITLDYGMPEFVAPEIALKQEKVGLPADMWAVGTITYLLLSGLSPFRGRDDVDTLENVKSGKYSLDIDPFPDLSLVCRDFIKKLLIYDPNDRMNVQEALQHPWLRLPVSSEPFPIPTDRHKLALKDIKDWCKNASSRTTYRRNPLSGAYFHPSRMVYPPGVPDRILPTPESREKIIIEDSSGMPDSISNYQMGPDTYLLQVRDSDFPSRLRRYMKVAADRSPTIAQRMRADATLARPTVLERRRFTDVYDEEVKEERTRGGYSAPFRMKHEPSFNLDAKKEADAYLENKRKGKAPFFREKLQTKALVEGEEAVFSCLALGEPPPNVQFFRNDFLITTTNNRIKLERDNDGRSLLKFSPAEAGDTGIIRAVARNNLGEVSCRSRFLIGHKPACPEFPQVTNISDTEVLLRWSLPHDDGVSRVLCYALEVKEEKADEWRLVAENIDHEFFCVRHLQPSTPYLFRLKARNKYGWGPTSMTSDIVTTKDAGTPKLQVSLAMKHQQDITERGINVIDAVDQVSVRDYGVESDPIPLIQGDPKEMYTFMAEIARGRFSVIIKCSERAKGVVRVGKLVPKRTAQENMMEREYSNLKHLCHERIVSLIEAYDTGSAFVFILEKLHGMDVLTYLANRSDYSEQIVVEIISQVLNGLQYLHWRGLVHLDLQPDNIVMTSPRLVDVKLVDLASAQNVTRRGLPVESVGLVDYTSPEVLNDEEATVESDIWSVGVLAYVFLSGVSPFAGATKEETNANITYVRFVYEHLFKGISGEAERFLMAVFKRHPTKRPTADECLDHRWLQINDHMLRKRERAVFPSAKIRLYEESYHAQRALNAVPNEDFTDLIASGSNALSRSETVVFDTQTPF